MNDINSILMGTKVPQATFKQPGDAAEGIIVSISEPYQEREYDPSNPGNGPLKFFKSGTPIMSFYVDIQTRNRDASIDGDDGIRRIYMDGARIKKAVRSAVVASGAKGLDEGGYLSLTYAADEQPGDHRSGKIWQVAYTPGNPASTVLMGEQPAPQQYAAAAAPAPAPQTQQLPPAPATAAAGPTAEQVAALKAMGIDPATVFPNYVG